MSYKFQVGDHVSFRAGKLWGPWWTGVISGLASGGRRVEITFSWSEDHAGRRPALSSDGTTYEAVIWRRAWRVKLIEAFKPPPEPEKLPAVDVHVLAELTAIQESLGSKEALLDMLRDIRKTYGSSTVKKED